MKYCDLVNLIKNEEAARKFLQNAGVLPKERHCAAGHLMIYEDQGNRYRCRKGSCNVKIALRQGSWLSQTRLPLRIVILYLHMWANGRNTRKHVVEELGIASKAVGSWNAALRELLVEDMLHRPLIGGIGTTVEIDETLLAKRKYNRGRILPAQWVFGGICRETREAFMMTVPDRTAETLKAAMLSHVLPGTTVISDCWKAYFNLAEWGYKHQTVNHSKNFVDPVTGAHTQTIERQWKNAKDQNRRRNGTHRHTLDSHLSEYLWRSSLKGKDPFETILTLLATKQSPE